MNTDKKKHIVRVSKGYMAIEFPIFKTKIEGLNRKFDLTNPRAEEEYFQLKAGREIEMIREYLKKNTFIAYLLGKKNSGKGTYAKMFAKVVSPDRIEHLSIGDMVREIDPLLRNNKKREEFIEFLRNNYRGLTPIEELISSLDKRSTSAPLLPTELILTLVKKKISESKKKALFIDGFPRNLDQVSFSLFFRDLVGYRSDPDFFVLISVPQNVIAERIKYRRVCPLCQTSRNLKLFPTSKIGYDKEKKEFYLICDNPLCQAERMLPKEGDQLGIEPIKERLATDEKLMEKAFSLYGIPKVLLRNSIPQGLAKKYVDDYEITPEYYFEEDKKTNKIIVKEKPWVFLDDEGKLSYSLLAQPVVVSLIKQIAKSLKCS